MLVQEKTKQEALSNAFNELNKVGGDFDKLTPKSKILIGEAQSTLIPGMNSEVKQILADDPSDSQGKAKQLMGQIDDIRNLSSQAIKHGGAANPENGQQPAAKPNANIDPVRYNVSLIDQATDKLKGLPKEQAVKFIDEAPTLSDAEKIAVKNSIINPKAPTFSNTLSSEVQNAPNIR
jgi:hypothetical protein